jgi:hypothetical protein
VDDGGADVIVDAAVVEPPGMVSHAAAKNPPEMCTEDNLALGNRS